MAEQQEQQQSPTQLAELSAQADGSLDPGRRRAVEQWIAGSPQIRTLYERELVAVEALQRVAGERAPAPLHARIESERARRDARPRWKPAYAALAGALACAVAALVLLLPGG